jgi:hypothetical protein
VLGLRSQHDWSHAQVARRAFVGVGIVRQSDQPAGTRALKSRRRQPLPDERSPALWSEEEAFYRQALRGGFVPYKANKLGGALRRLHWYHKDHVGRSKEDGEDPCNKKIHHGKKLSPGLFVRSLLLFDFGT